MNQSLDRPRLPLSSFAVAIVITGTIFAGFIWQGTRSFEQFPHAQPGLDRGGQSDRRHPPLRRGPGDRDGHGGGDRRYPVEGALRDLQRTSERELQTRPRSGDDSGNQRPCARRGGGARPGAADRGGRLRPGGRGSARTRPRGLGQSDLHVEPADLQLRAGAAAPRPHHPGHRQYRHGGGRLRAQEMALRRRHRPGARGLAAHLPNPGPLRPRERGAAGRPRIADRGADARVAGRDRSAPPGRGRGAPKPSTAAGPGGQPSRLRQLQGPGRPFPIRQQGLRGLGRHRPRRGHRQNRARRL